MPVELPIDLHPVHARDADLDRDFVLVFGGQKTRRAVKAGSVLRGFREEDRDESRSAAG